MRITYLPFKKLTGITPLVILLAVFLTGCMANSASTKKKSVKSSSTDTKTTTLPTFTTGNNFIQNGSSVYTNSVSIDLNFSDSVQLRGKDVDTYIRTAGTSTVACLTSRFSATSSVVILAAIPRSVYNFTTQGLEYYYSIAPSDITT
ncbi:MAG: hypothetical protein K2Q18_17830, partial [Bdellovibrionales bacterium]|nr:hypothetical protein [Bdellovibrionales bacterium]